MIATTELQQVKSLIQGINECDICFESKNPSLILVECGHCLCCECLANLLNTQQSTCPYCRKKVRSQALPIRVPTKLVNSLREVQKLLDCETSETNVSDSQMEEIKRLIKPWSYSQYYDNYPSSPSPPSSPQYHPSSPSPPPTPPQSEPTTPLTPPDLYPSPYFSSTYPSYSSSFPSYPYPSSYPRISRFSSSSPSSFLTSSSSSSSLDPSTLPSLSETRSREQEEDESDEEDRGRWRVRDRGIGRRREDSRGRDERDRGMGMDRPFMRRWSEWDGGRWGRDREEDRSRSWREYGDEEERRRDRWEDRRREDSRDRRRDDSRDRRREDSRDRRGG